jgi:predicted acylesterase/phospholipase RssA
VVEGLTIKSGLYNDKLLGEFLATELADIGPMQRFTDVGITDVVNGVYVDNIETLDTNLVDVMFASFSYAGFFPPAESMGGTWFDGAVIWDVDVFSAVNKCMETHAPADIVVDVLLTSQKSLSRVDASNFNTLHTLLRSGRILRYYSIMDGLLRAQFAYPEITFRNIISPSADLEHQFLPLLQD